MLDIGEKLFFAIFGQKEADAFAISLRQKQQPKWTVFLFKVSFSMYMLVTVIVLINLLIAMMSDTYHNIQSQSDIEWKYGLSKLIRKMQKTKTAPSPLNLVTSLPLWTYLKRSCAKKRTAKPKTDRLRGYMEPDMQQSGVPAYSFAPNNRILPLPRTRGSINFSLLQSSPANSQTSISNIPRIYNVVDWDVIRRKYRMQYGDEVEKPSNEGATITEVT